MATKRKYARRKGTLTAPFASLNVNKSFHDPWRKAKDSTDSPPDPRSKRKLLEELNEVRMELANSNLRLHELESRILETSQDVDLFKSLLKRFA